MRSKIMVIDDESSIRESLDQILRLEGYEVEAIESGARAIHAFQDSMYDLILLDLKMPDMDGIEVFKRIHQISPETRVILLTGHGSLESAIEALRLGAQDYLLKPVTSEEIIHSVASGLTRRAEQQKKRFLIDQIETAVTNLKQEEGLYLTPTAKHTMFALENGVLVDMARREIWRGNLHVTMTPTEGKLMQVLLENRGRVLSHRELVLLVQGYDASDYEAPEVLRPLISRLRRKLKIFPDSEKWIVNVRGTGYLFETETETPTRINSL